MFDPLRCAKNLGIPVRIGATPEGTGGYTNMTNRCIVINKALKDDTRVWVHEIAHALMDYRDPKDAMHVAAHKHIYAKSEICADTTAFMVCVVLKCADKQTYLNYMENYIGQLTLKDFNRKFLKELIPTCVETARKILITGGYYNE
jgi:Zn-dependent peptidase ImmA (M78 family)